jgi:hypothetical protein
MAHNKADSFQECRQLVSHEHEYVTGRSWVSLIWKTGIPSREDLDEHGKINTELYIGYMTLPFLKEMRKFNPDKGNFDRISDAMIQMFMQKEHYVKSRRQRRKQKSFYKRKLFDSPYSSGVTESY